jgi:hypothetical protein
VWVSAYKHDSQAFLLPLTNAAGLPCFKVKAIKQPEFAVNHMVHHSSYCLAVFGNRDLYTPSNAHTNAVSYTDGGNAYPLPPDATDETFLVGDGDVVDDFGYLHFKVGP